MGGIVHIFCDDCGYDRGRIFLGCGSIGPKPEYEVAPCYKCRVVKHIDISESELFCKTCKSELELFDDDAKSYECPKCNKLTLRMLFGGMWD